MIIDMAAENPDMINMKAAAIIWEVNLYQKITDLWGHIPHSAASKGISSLNYAPAYDEQKEVYDQMLNKLKEAVDMFDPAQRFFNPESDLIYAGNIDKWMVLGHSLRLRIATRINRVDPQKYEQVLSELSSMILMSSNDESALFPFNSVAKNHLYEVMSRGEAITQNNPSKFMVDLLVNAGDPRIRIFLEKAPLSFLPIYPEYNGVPNLLPASDPIWNSYNPDGDWGDISRIGNWFLRNETPGVVMSYSEVCFLLAEAALNGFWNGDPSDLVAEGIRANIQFFNDYGDGELIITDEETDVYLQSLGETTLEQIITQKWITFIYEMGYEAYNEYRRTGYPELTDYHGNPIDQDIFPVRLIYPYAEYTLNRDHYNAAIASQGADNEFTRIWWDTE
jgi:hypothetical protein